MELDVSAALWLYRNWRLWIEPERLRMRRAVLHWTKDCDKARVLEIGGGTSFVRSRIEKQCEGVTYISSDISPTDQTDMVFDANDMPFEDGSVDVVLAMEVLEHMPDPAVTVAEVSRVLRPGGIAVVTVPFMFGVHDFRDYQRFTPLGMETLLGEHGMHVADMRRRGGTFVAASGLVRHLILTSIVGEPKDWRAQGRRKKLLWLVATGVLTPWVLVTWLAMGLDAAFDRSSANPPGYFFLCRKAA